MTGFFGERETGTHGNPALITAFNIHRDTDQASKALACGDFDDDLPRHDQKMNTLITNGSPSNASQWAHVVHILTPRETSMMRTLLAHITHTAPHAIIKSIIQNFFLEDPRNPSSL